MAIYTMADNGIDITVQRDAAMYNLFASGQDLVIGGIGQELSCSFNGLVVTCESGECLIQGRHVTITGTETVTVPANSNGFIVINYDLTKPIGEEGSLSYANSITTGDLNNGDSVRDIALYSYSSNTSSITSLTDERNLVADLNSSIKLSINSLSNDKAPKNHAVNATTYGLGTTGVYGHTKLVNNLTQSSYADGLALSAYQGKLLNDKITTLSSTVSSHTTQINSLNTKTSYATHNVDKKITQNITSYNQGTYGAYMRRIGNIVTLELDLQFGTVPSGNEIVVFQNIPSEFRPAYKVSENIVCEFSNSTSPVFTYFTVQTDGTIKFGKLTEYMIVRATITYIH